jgi:hypothetical protein
MTRRTQSAIQTPHTNRPRVTHPHERVRVVGGKPLQLIKRITHRSCVRERAREKERERERESVCVCGWVGAIVCVSAFVRDSVGDEANTFELAEVVFEAVSGTGKEHKVAWHIEAFGHLTDRPRSELSTHQHQIQLHLRIHVVQDGCVLACAFVRVSE